MLKKIKVSTTSGVHLLSHGASSLSIDSSYSGGSGDRYLGPKITGGYVFVAGNTQYILNDAFNAISDGLSFTGTLKKIMGYPEEDYYYFLTTDTILKFSKSNRSLVGTYTASGSISYASVAESPSSFLLIEGLGNLKLISKSTMSVVNSGSQFPTTFSDNVQSNTYFWGVRGSNYIRVDNNDLGSISSYSGGNSATAFVWFNPNTDEIFNTNGSTIYKSSVSPTPVTPIANSTLGETSYSKKWLVTDENKLIVGADDSSTTYVKRADTATLTQDANYVSMSGTLLQISIHEAIDPNAPIIHNTTITIPASDMTIGSGYTLSSGYLELTTSKKTTKSGSFSKSVNYVSAGIPVGAVIIGVVPKLDYTVPDWGTGRTSYIRESLNSNQLINKNFSASVTTWTTEIGSNYVAPSTPIDANTVLDLSFTGYVGSTSSLGNTTHRLQNFKLEVTYSTPPEAPNVNATISVPNGSQQTMTAKKHNSRAFSDTSGINQSSAVKKGAKYSFAVTHGIQQAMTAVKLIPIVKTGTVAVTNGVGQLVVGKKLARAPPSTNTVGVKQSLSAKKTAKNSVSPNTVGARQTLTFKKGRNIQIPVQTLGIQQALTFKKGINVSIPVQTLGIQQTMTYAKVDVAPVDKGIRIGNETEAVLLDYHTLDVIRTLSIPEFPSSMWGYIVESATRDVSGELCYYAYTTHNPGTGYVTTFALLKNDLTDTVAVYPSVITGFVNKLTEDDDYLYVYSGNGMLHKIEKTTFTVITSLNVGTLRHMQVDGDYLYCLQGGYDFVKRLKSDLSVYETEVLPGYIMDSFAIIGNIAYLREYGTVIYEVNINTMNVVYTRTGLHSLGTDYLLGTVGNHIWFSENYTIYIYDTVTREFVATTTLGASSGYHTKMHNQQDGKVLIVNYSSPNSSLLRINTSTFAVEDSANFAYEIYNTSTGLAIDPPPPFTTLSISHGDTVSIAGIKKSLRAFAESLGIQQTMSIRKSTVRGFLDTVGFMQTLTAKKTTKTTISVTHGTNQTLAGKKTSSRNSSFTLGFNQTALGKKASSRALSVPNGFTQTLTARKAVSKGTSLQTLGIQQSLTVKKHTARALTVITHGVQQTLSAKKSATRALPVLQCGIQQTLTFKKGRNIQIPAQSLGVNQTLTFKKGRNIVIPVQTLGVQQTILATKKSLISFTESLGLKQTALARKHTTTAISVSNGAVTTGTGRESSTGFLYSSNGDRIFLSAKKAVSSSALSTTVGINTSGTGIESHTVAVSLSSGDKMQMTVKKSVKNTTAVTFLLGNQQTLNGKKLSTRTLSQSLGIQQSLSGKKLITRTLSLTLGDTPQLTAKKTAKQGLSLSLGDTVYVEQGKYISVHVGVQHNITAQKNAIKSVDTSSGVNTSLTAKKNQTTILEPDSLGVKQTVTTLKNVPISVSDSLGERIFVTKNKATQSSLISLTAGIQMNVHIGGKFFVLMGLNQFLSAVKNTATILPVALGATVSLALMKSTQNFLAETDGIQMTLTAQKAVKQSVSITLNTQETVSGMKQSTVAVAETVGDSYTVEAVKYAESSLTLHHGVLLFVSSVDSAQTTIQMTQGTKQTLTAVKGMTADVLVETNTEESVLGRKNAKKAVTVSSGARQTFTAIKSTTRALTFSLTPTVAVSSHKAGSSDPVLNSATLFEVLTASAQKFSLEVEPNAGEHIAVTVEKASSDSLLLTLASEMTHEGEKGAESELTDSLGFLIDVTVTRPNLAKIKLSQGINLTVIGVRSKYISLADSLGVQVEISTEATSKIFRVKPEKRVGTLFIPSKYTLTLAPKKYVLKLFVPVKVSYKMSPIKRTYKSAKVVRKY